MDRTQDTPADRLEGMLIAHRKILAELAAIVHRHLDENVLDRMEDRSVLRDGQEDPGAVPTDGVATELAIAEEAARIASLARVVLQTGRDEDAV